MTNDTPAKKLLCTDCGATDGKYIVSVEADGVLKFQCSSCDPATVDGVCAAPVCDVQKLVTMFEMYGMLG